MCNYDFIYKINGDILSLKYHEYETDMNDDIDNNSKFKLIMIDKNIKQIGSGLQHTIFYKNNGDILSMGCNWRGQLGIILHRIYILKLQL